MKAKSLADLIFRHYLRSALVPVLTVELLLVSAYFLVNAWNNRETELALRREVQQILPHLASREAAQLQDGFARIARETNLFAKEHEALVADPARFTVRGEIPILAKSPNGTLHQPNRQTGSSLFYAKNAVVGPAQREIAIKTAALDPLYKHMVDDVPNVVATYYNTSDNMNRLYPYIKNVWEQYPADLTMSDYNFFYLADAKHNPSRKPVWTGAYLDPAGQGWMVSCVAPVFLRDSLHGVVGLDVTIDRIVKNLLGQDLPWSASAFLVDDSGMILAMPAPVEELFGLKELKQHVYESAVKTEQHKPSSTCLPTPIAPWRPDSDPSSIRGQALCPSRYPDANRSWSRNASPRPVGACSWSRNRPKSSEPSSRSHRVRGLSAGPSWQACCCSTCCFSPTCAATPGSCRPKSRCPSPICRRRLRNWGRLYSTTVPILR
jgi:hypothetical protein